MNEEKKFSRNRITALIIGASFCITFLSLVYSYIKVTEQEDHVQKIERQLLDCKKLAERQVEEARSAMQIALQQSQIAREEALLAKKIADEQASKVKQPKN